MSKHSKIFFAPAARLLSFYSHVIIDLCVSHSICPSIGYDFCCENAINVHNVTSEKAEAGRKRREKKITEGREERKEKVERKIRPRKGGNLYYVQELAKL